MAVRTEIDGEAARLRYVYTPSGKVLRDDEVTRRGVELASCSVGGVSTATCR